MPACATCNDRPTRLCPACGKRPVVARAAPQGGPPPRPSTLPPGVPARRLPTAPALTATAPGRVQTGAYVTQAQALAAGWKPIEPDKYWGAAAQPRFHRWTEAAFYGRQARPQTDLLDRLSSSLSRFAWSCFLIGFLGILGMQFMFPQVLPVALASGASFLGFFRVLALVAPVFEEYFKFGLALGLVAWTGSRGFGRGGTLGLRMVMAWAVGAGFGWFEHTFVYSSEDDVHFIGRMAFHGLAAGLSMAAFSILELRVPARRWFLFNALSTPLHWAVNAMAVPMALLAAVLEVEWIPEAWVAVVLVVGLIATLALPWMAGVLVRAAGKGLPDAARTGPKPG